MKLLIVDTSTETQVKVSDRLKQFNNSDMEMLDLQVQLVSEADFQAKISSADVLVLGSGLGDRATAIARQALATVSWLHIVMFVSDEAYGAGAFRAAHSSGVRKVFPDSASPLDFLQELVAIHAEFRREGRTREGFVVAVTHAKGGVGATSIAAALGELCSINGRRTLMWDLDVETRDLSRSLTINGAEAKVVSSWVNGTRDITRQSLSDAVISISKDASMLIPPDRMAESMDLICHPDGIGIVQRVLELARVTNDVVIVDTGGRMGPSIGAILRDADVVLIVIDDTVLGLTAVDLYLTFVKTLVGGVDRICFLVNFYSGSLLGVPQIAAELEPAHNLGDAAWRLPPVPNDPKSAMWPGTGRTLYSLGQRVTRQTLEVIAQELGLIPAAGDFSAKRSPVNSREESNTGSGGWLKKIFGKSGSSQSSGNQKYLDK